MSELRVLVADGDGERGREIAEACAARGIRQSLASHGGAALEQALQDPPALLVAQRDLPLIDGPRLVSILRTNPRTRELAVLLLADRPGEPEESDDGDRVLAPPFDADRVARLVQSALGIEDPPSTETGGTAGALHGELAQMPPSELLPLLHQGRKTGRLELGWRSATGESVSGDVWLRDGQLVGAATGALRGAKALFRMLTWERGTFAFRPGEQPPEVSITAATPAVLREGARQLREWQRLRVELPPRGATARLKVPRSALPRVIHPLTQDVLTTLERYSRVGDIVDHAVYPDYQVLRTLHTLVERGIVELATGARAREPAPPGGPLLSASDAARLREWLDVERPGARASRRAKLMLFASDGEATRAFARLLAGAEGVEIEARALEGSLAPDELAAVGRIEAEGGIGVDLLQVPAVERFRPLWPLAVHGALAALLLRGDAPGDAGDGLRDAARALQSLPGARLFPVRLTRAADSGGHDEELGPVTGLPCQLSVDEPRRAAQALHALFAEILP